MILLSRISKKYAAQSIAYVIISILMIIFFAESSVLSEPDLTGIGTQHALFIGISKYDHWPDLESPAKDAEAIKNILVSKYGFLESNITLLTDNTAQKPTAANILRALNGYLETLSEKDNLLIFFAGRSEEEGDDSYWIPADAQKDFKTNWLSHSELCRKIFAGKDLKVNNLCILTDSFFSDQLLGASKFVPLYPYDLRYSEKIAFKARKKSRQIISLNTHHFPPNGTDGLGIFTYYIKNALSRNQLKIIDIENLVFDETVSYPIRRITGAKMNRGRLKASADDNGQFTLIRQVPLPYINVAEVIVSPSEPSYPGMPRKIEARISEPERVKDVYVEFHDQRQPMCWNGFTWEYNYTPDKPEDIPFQIYALNDDELRGPTVNMNIATLKRPAAITKILSAEVKQKKGTEDTYIVSAATDMPAKEIKLFFDGKAYSMAGKDLKWHYDLRLTGHGEKTYSMVAVNEDGVEGLPKYGSFYVKPTLVNVTRVATDREAIHPGDGFRVTAITDGPAQTVTARINGKQHDMQGADTDWHVELSLSDIGQKTITVSAKNIEGQSGAEKETTISVTPYPAVEVHEIISPEHIYAGEPFMLRLKTKDSAKSVLLSVNGKQHPMEGSEKDWKYAATINEIGMNTLTAVAENRSGVQGNAYHKKLIVEKRTAKPINVASVSLEPKKAPPGQEFSFEIKTDQPAKSVTITIDDKTHELLRTDDAGSFWRFKTRFDRPGDKDFSVVAANADGIQGSPWFDTLRVTDFPVNISSVKVSPERGFSGEFFEVSAKTDRQANKVYLLIDGKKHEMNGAGEQWSLKQKRDAAGKQTLVVIAVNNDGVEGDSKSVSITTEKLPLSEIVSVKMTPEEILSGDTVNMQVLTNKDATKVYVDFGGLRHEMQGSGKSWYYEGRINISGKVYCKFISVNKSGEAAEPFTQVLKVKKPPEPIVNVTKNSVNPEKGFPSTRFTFTVITDHSAKKVTLVFDDDRYDMSGSNNKWTYAKQFDKPGSIRFYAVAVNADNKEGQRKWAEFTVEDLKDRYELIDNLTVLDRAAQKKRDRFVDNGDGTVTDLYTSLMWLKRPYTLNGQTYDQAVEYCQNLNYRGLAGWRLPNIDEWKKMAPALGAIGHPFEEVTVIFPYWSKTSHRGRIYMKTMDLRSGKVSFQKTEGQGYVWPVRYVGPEKTGLFSQ